MKIHRLQLKNFKKFSEFELNLHPRFTLLIGGNGAGKTSVLDALAVALGVWLIEPPDSTLANSRRGILASEIHLEQIWMGDRDFFVEAAGGVSISAVGEIEGVQDVVWEHRINPGKRKATNQGARDALAIVAGAYLRARTSTSTILPVIAYYGAGRTWLAHRERPKSTTSKEVTRRWAAFYDCLNERIRVADLGDWFRREAIASVNRNGVFRPGFEVVRHAVLSCVPGADRMWYDGDREEIVLSIDGKSQPFSNLSAGQRMMLALVADIAIRAVTQNNHLVSDKGGIPYSNGVPLVLADTPGVVLIDELDVHLHPTWQRTVAQDLMTIFPKIQFVCTTHSPQVIGEIVPDQIRILDTIGDAHTPTQSYGLDTNSILTDVMGTDSRNSEGSKAIDAVESALDEGDLDQARKDLESLKKLQHGDTRDTVRLEATINNLEAFTDEGD